MEIVDAQIHIGPGRIDETLAAMDALGVGAVVIDEYWIGLPGSEPCYALPEGAHRPVQPTAELAALTHPDRFCYLVRIDRKDHEVETVIRLAGQTPHARALRITPGVWSQEARPFAEGAYDGICAAACDAGLPLFVFAPGQAEEMGSYARRFPQLRLIVDHCGLVSPVMRRALGGQAGALDPAAQSAAFDEVLTLAELPNVALKWAHAPAMFGVPGYPGDGLWPFLRKAVGRFGANRVMWASDYSANQTGETWAELLFGALGCPGLSTSERAAVFGGTVRRWLDWPG